MFDFTPKTRCSARDANFTTASAPQTLKGTSSQAISRRANEKQNLFTRSGRRGTAAFDGPLPEEDKQLLICSLRNIQTFYSISSSVELQNRKTNREQSAEASLTPTLAFNEAKFHLRLWIFSSFQSHGRSNHHGDPSPSSTEVICTFYFEHEKPSVIDILKFGVFTLLLCFCLDYLTCASLPSVFVVLLPLFVHFIGSFPTNSFAFVDLLIFCVSSFQKIDST